MITLLWDLDGTLLDSYKVILESVLAVLSREGMTPDPAETYKRLIETSVKSFFGEVSEYPNRLWERYRALNAARDGEIRLMDGAAETLRALTAMGVPNFVFTHKGETARAVLRRLGVLTYITDVLSAGGGIPRKPAPDGIDLLIARHNLDRRQTFYIGDRPIDMECAKNAGVRGILFLPPSSPASPTGLETYTVSTLTEIPEIVYTNFH